MEQSELIKYIDFIISLNLVQQKPITQNHGKACQRLMSCKRLDSKDCGIGTISGLFLRLVVLFGLTTWNGNSVLCNTENTQQLVR